MHKPMEVPCAQEPGEMAAAVGLAHPPGLCGALGRKARNHDAPTKGGQVLHGPPVPDRCKAL